MAEQELVSREETVLAAEQDQPKNLMEVIYRAAMDPRVDIEKMSALVALKERIDARDAEIEFNAAYARLAPKLPRIEKDGVIKNKDGSVRSRYSRYEDIDLATRPILAEEGFAFSFDTEDAGAKQIKIIAKLSHRLGHSEKSHVILTTDNQVITGNQAVGATISFGKRTLVTNMLNIICVGQDTDGHTQKPITDEQAMRIHTLLTDTKANVAKFLEWAGVGKVEDILDRDYRKVMSMLEAKARK